MKIYNPNREERAFLYQEAQDLEILVKDLGSLSVMVEELAARPVKSAAHDYRVTFMVAPETFGMRVQAVDDNLFDAAIAAKKETLKRLNALVNAMPRPRVGDADAAKIPVENLH